jgi:hypothetical protein
MGKVVRITLTHAIAGSIVISEPEGWKDAVLYWERHPDLHCVPETYKAAFSSYGSNGVDNGGRDWIKNIEAVYGIDAIITTLVEEAEEFSDYTELSRGTLPIRILIETIDLDHRLQFDFSPASFWTTFLSKFETPVDIQSTTDLYGNACAVLAPITIPLPSQVIQQKMEDIQKVKNDMGLDWTGTPASASPNIDFNQNQYVTFDLDTEVIEEINAKFLLGTLATDDLPKPNFILQYGGQYTIEISISITFKNLETASNIYEYTSMSTLSPTFQHAFRLYLQVNNEIPIEISYTSHSQTVAPVTSSGAFTPTSPGVDAWDNFYYLDTLSLSAGDKLRLFFRVENGAKFYEQYNGFSALLFQPVILGVDNSDIQWSDLVTKLPFQAIGSPASDPVIPSFFKIKAETIYIETTAPAILIHDLGAAITERITGQPNSFKSNYLGRTNTLARTYPSNGCGSANIAVKGIQLRGYTLAEKPFAESMKDYLLGGINPIFNLGCRYVKTDTEEYVQIEPSKEFYPDRVSITLNNVRNITRSYDLNGFYNQVKVGYEKYEIEEASGLNIPQSYRTLATILKSVGGILEIMSSYIAGDLTIERTRRTTREKSADYKYDNDVFIIAVRDTGSGFTPELSENYSSVTGLLNESTRYNKNLTPYRNLVRWLNIASNGLQSYLSSKFKFLDGTANFDMASTRNDGGCSGDFGGAGLSEKQDLDVSTEFLHLPLLYTIKHYITSEQIQALRADPEAAINVSQTETDHVKFYIKTAEARPHDGNFTLVAWPKEFFDIKNIENNDSEQENPITQQSYVFDDTFPHPPFN